MKIDKDVEKLFKERRIEPDEGSIVVRRFDDGSIDKIDYTYKNGLKGFILVNHG